MLRGRALIQSLVDTGVFEMRRLSELAGKNHAYIQQFLTRGTPRELPEKVRDALASYLGIPADNLREEGGNPQPVDLPVGTRARITKAMLADPPPPAPPPPSNVRPAPDAPRLPYRGELPRDVPVMGTAAGSDGEGAFELNMGEPVDYVLRGPGIANARKVFSIYVEGDSMSPWREPGGLVYVDPARKIAIGNHVLLVMDGAEHGDPPQSFIKRLVRRGAQITTFEQYNPKKELEFDTQAIKQMLRVLEWDEVMGL